MKKSIFSLFYVFILALVVTTLVLIARGRPSEPCTTLFPAVMNLKPGIYDPETSIPVGVGSSVMIEDTLTLCDETTCRVYLFVRYDSDFPGWIPGDVCGPR